MQESGEMYLESILVLSHKMSAVRSVDVAEHMGFSKPSVSRAMGLLKNSGHINVDGSGLITLTESGKKIAENIYERHKILSFLLEHIGVDKETASDDACKIEHYISDTTFSALKKYIKNKGINPDFKL